MCGGILCLDNTKSNKNCTQSLYVINICKTPSKSHALHPGEYYIKKKKYDAGFVQRLLALLSYLIYCKYRGGRTHNGKAQAFTGKILISEEDTSTTNI